jgi:thioredoxin 1
MAMSFTDLNFDNEVLQSDLPVLVDFYADWCGPCKMMAPVIDELSSQYEGKAKIGKLNVDQNGTTAQKYRVMSIPTLLLIKDGKVIDTMVGAVPKQQLEEKLKSII